MLRARLPSISASITCSPCLMTCENPLTHSLGKWHRYMTRPSSPFALIIWLPILPPFNALPPRSLLPLSLFVVCLPERRWSRPCFRICPCHPLCISPLQACRCIMVANSHIMVVTGTLVEGGKRGRAPTMPLSQSVHEMRWSTPRMPNVHHRPPTPWATNPWSSLDLAFLPIAQATSSLAY